MSPRCVASGLRAADGAVLPDTSLSASGSVTVKLEAIEKKNAEI